MGAIEKVVNTELVDVLATIEAGEETLSVIRAIAAEDGSWDGHGVGSEESASLEPGFESALPAGVAGEGAGAVAAYFEEENFGGDLVGE